MGMDFETWMRQVDEMGQSEGVFDPSDLRVVCGHPKRPYIGKDGIFYQLWADGVPYEFAIGEALAAD